MEQPVPPAAEQPVVEIVSAAEAPVDSGRAAEMAVAAAVLKLQARAKNGISWFFWISGLSLLNTIISALGSQMIFLFGLAVTQVVDGVASGLVIDFPEKTLLIQGLAIGLNVLLAGFFALLGYFGYRKERWALIVGMIFYILDMVIFVLAGEWLSGLFHIWALVGLVGGLGALNQLRKLEPAKPVNQFEPVMYEEFNFGKVLNIGLYVLTGILGLAFTAVLVMTVIMFVA